VYVPHEPASRGLPLSSGSARGITKQPMTTFMSELEVSHHDFSSSLTRVKKDTIIEL